MLYWITLMEFNDESVDILEWFNRNEETLGCLSLIGIAWTLTPQQSPFSSTDIISSSTHTYTFLSLCLLCLLLPQSCTGKLLIFIEKLVLLLFICLKITVLYIDRRIYLCYYLQYFKKSTALNKKIVIHKLAICYLCSRSARLYRVDVCVAPCH